MVDKAENPNQESNWTILLCILDSVTLQTAKSFFDGSN